MCSFQMMMPESRSHNDSLAFKGSSILSCSSSPLPSSRMFLWQIRSLRLSSEFTLRHVAGFGRIYTTYAWSWSHPSLSWQVHTSLIILKVNVLSGYWCCFQRRLTDWVLSYLLSLQLERSFGVCLQQINSAYHAHWYLKVQSRY